MTLVFFCKRKDMPPPADLAQWLRTTDELFDSVWGCQVIMIDLCFWCNRPKKEGQQGNPTFNNYEPCSRCGEKWNKGILVIEVLTEPNKNPPIVDELYPTGLWAVVSVENVKKVLTSYPSLDTILSTRTMYVNHNDWKTLFIGKNDV